MAAVWAAAFVAYDLPNGGKIVGTSKQWSKAARAACRPLWNAGKLARLGWLALPLGFVMTLVSLNANIPRYFVESYLGERQLGIFASLAYLYTVGSLFVSSLEQSTCPRLAEFYLEGNWRAFQLLLSKLVAIGIVLAGTVVLLSVLGGREVIALLYRPEYAQHVDAFIWLMLASGIGAVAGFIRCGVTAARYFTVQLPLWLLVVGCTTIACRLLVPSLGLKGAAIGLAVGACVQLMGNLAVIVRAVGVLRSENP